MNVGVLDELGQLIDHDLIDLVTVLRIDGILQDSDAIADKAKDGESHVFVGQVASPPLFVTEDDSDELLELQLLLVRAICNCLHHAERKATESRGLKARGRDEDTI